MSNEENKTIPLKRIVFDNIVTSSNYLKLKFDNNISFIVKAPTITSGTEGGDSDNNVFYNFTPYDCKDYSNIIINTLDGSNTDFKPSAADTYKKNYKAGNNNSNAEGTIKYDNDNTDYLSSSYRYCDYIDNTIINEIGNVLKTATSDKRILPRLGSKKFNFKGSHTTSNFNYLGIKTSDEFAALCNFERIDASATVNDTRSASIGIIASQGSEGIFSDGDTEGSIRTVATKNIPVYKYPFRQLTSKGYTKYILDFKNDEITSDIIFTNNVSTPSSFFNERIAKFPSNMNSVTVSTNALEKMYMGNNFITSLVSSDLPTLNGIANSNINLKNTFESCTNLTAVNLDRWSSFKIYDTDCTFKNTKVAYNPNFLGSHSNKETFNNSVALPTSTALALKSGITYESILAGKTNPSIKSINFNHSSSIPTSAVKTIFGGSASSIEAITCNASLTGTSTKLFSTGAVTVGYIPSKLLNSIGDSITASYTDSNVKGTNTSISISSGKVSFTSVQNTKKATNTFIDVSDINSPMSTSSVNLTQQPTATFKNTINKTIKCSDGIPSNCSVTVTGVALVSTNAAITRYDETGSLASLDTCKTTLTNTGNELQFEIESNISGVQLTNSVLNIGGVAQVSWSGKYKGTDIKGISYINMAKSILIKKLDLVTTAIYRVNSDGTLTPEYETPTPESSGGTLIPFKSVTLNGNKDTYTLTIDEKMVSGSGTITVNSDNTFKSVTVKGVKVSIKSIDSNSLTKVLGEGEFNTTDIQNNNCSLNVSVSPKISDNAGTTIIMTSETTLTAILNDNDKVTEFTLKDTKVMNNN